MVIERLARPHTVNTGSSLASSSQSVHHIPCSLQLFFDSESYSAFLKFRLSVETGQQEDLPPIYFLVPPEQITSVVQDGDEAGAAQDPEISRLCNSSRGTISLRIDLSRAGSLIGPQTCSPSVPAVARLDAMRCDLEWLGEQTRLTTHISRRAMSAVQLQAFCAAVSTPGLLTTSATHADISAMYEGQGGRVIENFSSIFRDDEKINDDENDKSTQSGSPPSYDEAAAKPFSFPPGSRQRQRHNPSVKRPRPSSSPEPGSGTALADIRDPLCFIQSICNKIVDERQALLRNEVVDELHRMEARIMHAVGERITGLHDELSDQILQVDGRATATAEEVLEEAIDDKVTGVKIEMEDFIKDEMRGMEENILGHLEAGTWDASFTRREEHR